MAFPVSQYHFFGVVAVAENHVQLVDALLNPTLETATGRVFLFSRDSGVVIVYFWEVNVGNVFFGFV